MWAQPLASAPGWPTPTNLFISTNGTQELVPKSYLFAIENGDCPRDEFVLLPGYTTVIVMVFELATLVPVATTLKVYTPTTFVLPDRAPVDALIDNQDVGFDPVPEYCREYEVVFVADTEAFAVELISWFMYSVPVTDSSVNPGAKIVHCAYMVVLLVGV